METGSAVIIFIAVILFCYIIYHSIPTKYKTLEGSFDGFINRILVRFEYENSQIHTIVYGGTVTGETYFVRKYLKLYLDQDLDQDQDQDKNWRSIIILCKDERDRINPETEKTFTEFNMCDINMITSKNMPNFKDSVIVLDDMSKNLIKDIAYYLLKEDIIIFKWF